MGREREVCREDAEPSSMKMPSWERKRNPNLGDSKFFILFAWKKNEENGESRFETKHTCGANSPSAFLICIS